MSKVVKVVFIEAPTIQEQPKDVKVDVGASATFTVKATGSGTITYQWKDSKGDIKGETDATYKITSTSSDMDGSKYYCVVTSEAGPVTSDPATLTLKTYSVKYDANGGTGAPTDTKKYFKDAVVKISTVKPDKGSNYIFGGWSDGSKTYSGEDSYTMGAGEVTFMAVWNAVPDRKVTFLDGEGGKIIATKTVKSPATTVDELPPNPTKNGFTFKEWQIVGGGVFSKSTKVTENMTVFAKWDEIPKCKLIYVQNNGNLSGNVTLPKILEYEVGTDVLVENPIYSGNDYKFTHWSDDKEGYNHYYSQGDKFYIPEGVKEVYLYAQWEVINTPPEIISVKGGFYAYADGGTITLTVGDPVNGQDYDIKVRDKETPKDIFTKYEIVSGKMQESSPDRYGWEVTQIGNDIEIWNHNYSESLLILMVWIVDKQGSASRKVKIEITDSPL
jgi:hypothetical protein